MRILFKAVGAILIAAVGVLGASSINAKISAKRKQLEKAVVMLQKLSGLIEYKKLPAVQAVTEAVNESGFTHIGISDNSGGIYDYCEFINKYFSIPQLEKLMDLKAAEKLNEALAGLGESGTEQEKNKLEYYILWFKEKLCAAKEHEKSTSKLYRALGLYGGAAAAILLM